MGYSSSLSDQEWEIIEPLLPRKKKTRPPTWTKRQIQAEKKPKWTTLIIVDSQATKNTCNATEL